MQRFVGNVLFRYYILFRSLTNGNMYICTYALSIYVSKVIRGTLNMRLILSNTYVILWNRRETLESAPRVYMIPTLLVRYILFSLLDQQAFAFKVAITICKTLRTEIYFATTYI